LARASKEELNVLRLRPEIFLPHSQPDRWKTKVTLFPTIVAGKEDFLTLTGMRYIGCETITVGRGVTTRTVGGEGRTVGGIRGWLTEGGVPKVTVLL
jgi:hypothetical protein